MSKYAALWRWIAAQSGGALELSFADIEWIAGFPPDHSFLNCKKELTDFGWKVAKISLKQQTIVFKQL